MKLILSILSCLMLFLALPSNAQSYGNKNATMHVLGGLKVDSGGISVPNINPTQRLKNKYPDTLAKVYRNSVDGGLYYMNNGVPTRLDGQGGSVSGKVDSGFATSVTKSDTLYTYTDPFGVGTSRLYTLQGFVNVTTISAGATIKMRVSYYDEALTNHVIDFFGADATNTTVTNILTVTGVTNFFSFPIMVFGGTNIIVYAVLASGTATYNLGSMLILGGKLL